jgi:hypothetical protein
MRISKSKKWYQYLGLTLAILGGLLASFYSIVAVFLIFKPIPGIQGELSWSLIGKIIGSYLIIGIGVLLAKRGATKEG